MGDETVLADLDPVGKAALDHVPAERALQKPEEQDAGQRRREPPRQPPPRQKPEERHGKRPGFPGKILPPISTRADFVPTF